MVKCKRIVLLLVRLGAFASTLCAAIVMVMSHEKTSFYGIAVEAKYSHTPAFKYFLLVNMIVSIYGFFVLFLPSESMLWRFAVALDMVFTVLLSSGLSAALSMALLGKDGNSYAGWLPICEQVESYCDQVRGALVSCFTALIIYMLLLFNSIHDYVDPFLIRNT